jgi:glycerophosphoryl diester phosphodiesterase
MRGRAGRSPETSLEVLQAAAGQGGEFREADIIRKMAMHIVQDTR